MVSPRFLVSESDGHRLRHAEMEFLVLTPVSEAKKCATRLLTYLQSAVPPSKSIPTLNQQDEFIGVD